MPARSTTHPGKIVGFKGVRGRPPTNIGKYLLRTDPNEQSGFQALNTTPQVIQDAKEYYLKAGELPPSLRSQRLMGPDPLHPSVLAKAKSKNISRGFVKPKSHQG